MTTIDKSKKAFRGSRKHVLDWTLHPAFLDEFAAMLGIAEVDLASSTFMPRSPNEPAEARLETFGPPNFQGHDWPALRSWWLKHPLGANTPNWDLALTAQIDGTPGLVLVEAKANEPEFSTAGKGQDGNASENSKANHIHIGEAIASANRGWQTVAPEARLCRDEHYQLSNRLAFTWKLATLGIPTVMVYLGFTGDSEVRGEAAMLRDDAHWQALFSERANGVGIAEATERKLDFGPAAAWVACRSRALP
jgi:hypothetical protein